MLLPRNFRVRRTAGSNGGVDPSGIMGLMGVNPSGVTGLGAYDMMDGGWEWGRISPPFPSDASPHIITYSTLGYQC